MKVLEVNNLTKKFKDLTAVDNINFSIEDGEIYGLLGPNGAGKSTVINMICGLISSDMGEIKILESDIKKNINSTKKNIGLVPQSVAVYWELTALENIKFFGSLYGLKGKELEEKSLEALEFVGLIDIIKEPCRNFSGGMSRRLNIACAIVHKPKIIIMDEPTVGIDPQSRNHILNSVKKLNKMGSTIIYTSHYMEEVEEICSKVGIMDHGKLIAEGTKEELKALITDYNYIKVNVNNMENLDIEKFKNINGINNINIKENTIIFEINKDMINIDKIMRVFVDNNISIKKINTVMPNLEDVFLKLTGRKLRN
ncbi:ABC transporter family protein [Clostridium argentinense CDC 2741]|uniref:ABC transporter family protein n=1 Tax=Clostridium argentinense CDC 2741 TaxID=1418104 RepID=A0A0C1ULG1_9CLOT|nr:ABC transporter ATP-binding protein [Clostridium argentinense]ARC85168.1 export ABC transporter ATP-binding protein [Clostridium argentinense]KIE48095.1 ABC transporter family protein [Clostridium argentinense CDC 2741]NFF39529.1 ABC transporter ATP-binding protein [Clostridium argentinense]NFP50924.1 ABC transporter ATP-binding protein [Clostridium argentinense]NFP72716.1 ABC transporter ATP-binding protein [Clostridium argentinense]